MNDREVRPIAIADGSRYYTIVSLAALFGTVVPLLARGVAAWSFFPALIGCIAVAARWRAGFFWFMIAIVWIVVADKLGLTPWEFGEYAISLLVQIVATRRLLSLPRGYGFPRMQIENPALDILFCFAVIVFAASFFRLIAVTRNVFPIDRRRQRFKMDTGQGARFLRLARGEDKRSPGLVERIEVMPMLIAVTAVVIVAEVFWAWLGDRSSLGDLTFTVQSFEEFSQRLVSYSVPIAIPNGVWRALLIMWMFFMIIVPVAAVLSLLGLRRVSAAEAALFLQDCVWRETRREQSRNNRWLAWAEQKYGRKRDRRDLKLERRARADRRL